MRIAFIGTGVMGTPMIQNLLKAGYDDIVVNTRTKSKAQEAMDSGAAWADTPKEAAEGADFVFTMVGFPKDVEEVYFGDDGVMKAAKEGTVLVDMTTTDPELSKRIAEEAASLGALALDAPVSGGDVGAKNGTLSIMVGGDKEAFDKALPLLEVMGSSIKHMGAAGAGQNTKMANQIAIAGALAGVCEALSYAQALGLDAEEVLDAIQGGAASSWQLSNLGPKMIKGDYAPGFYSKHIIKDLKIAKDQAQKAQTPLPVENLVLEEFERVDKGDLGTQALFEFYKKD